MFLYGFQKKKMKNNKIKYAICTVLLFLLIGGTIGFPVFYNYQSDRKTFHTVHSVEREEIVLYNPQDSNRKETVSAFIKNIVNSDGVSYVFSLNGTEGMVVTDLIKGLEKEIENGIQSGLLPDISGYDLENGAVVAEYWNIESDSYLINQRACWILQFGDGETFGFVFLIDAYTYTIYYAWLNCEETQQYPAHNYSSLELLEFYKAYYELEDEEIVKYNMELLEGENYSDEALWAKAFDYYFIYDVKPETGVNPNVMEVGLYKVKSWLEKYGYNAGIMEPTHSQSSY